MTRKAQNAGWRAVRYPTPYPDNNRTCPAFVPVRMIELPRTDRTKPVGLSVSGSHVRLMAEIQELN